MAKTIKPPACNSLKTDEASPEETGDRFGAESDIRQSRSEMTQSLKEVGLNENATDCRQKILEKIRELFAEWNTPEVEKVYLFGKVEDIPKANWAKIYEVVCYLSIKWNAENIRAKMAMGGDIDPIDIEGHYDEIAKKLGYENYKELDEHIQLGKASEKTLIRS